MVILEDNALNYGVSKAVDILFDLKLEDEQIKQILVKHFNILYKEAEVVIDEAKEFKSVNHKGS